MPAGRPRTHPVTDNDFSLWLKGLGDRSAVVNRAATRCGVSANTAGRWWTGAIRPSAEEAVKFAILYNDDDSRRSTGAASDLRGIYAPHPSDLENGLVDEWNDAAKKLVKILKYLKPEEKPRKLALDALDNAAELADARAASRRTRRVSR